MTEENNIIRKKKITKYEFYFKASLYDEFFVSNLEDDFFSGDVDGYSNSIKDKTTYSIEFEWIDIINNEYSNYRKELCRGFAEITLTCKRRGKDFLRFFVQYDEIDKKSGVLMKVGQYPSVADLEFQQLQEKYEKVLDKKYLKEFKKAVGLFAHGIGVGSFIYLRRIFEDLIQKAYIENKNTLNISSNDFKTKQHIDEKIEILKKYLPSQFLEMKIIYKILSKGVHELDEEICLKYFPILKLAIELILDQKIEDDVKKKKDDAVKRQLTAIGQDLKENEK